MAQPCLPCCKAAALAAARHLPLPLRKIENPPRLDAGPCLILAPGSKASDLLLPVRLAGTAGGTVKAPVRPPSLPIPRQGDACSIEKIKRGALLTRPCRCARHLCGALQPGRADTRVEARQHVNEATDTGYRAAKLTEARLLRLLSPSPPPRAGPGTQEARSALVEAHCHAGNSSSGGLCAGCRPS